MPQSDCAERILELAKRLGINDIEEIREDDTIESISIFLPNAILHSRKDSYGSAEHNARIELHKEAYCRRHFGILNTRIAQEHKFEEDL